MRTLIFLALAACAGSGAAPAPAPAPLEPKAEYQTVRFHSDALGVDKDYVVWLPPAYQGTTERFPVLYMLHGLGGSESDWRHLDIGAAAARVGLHAIIVMPDGDDGFYVDWPTAVDYDACLKSRRPFGVETDMTRYCVRTPRYEDYIVGDLIGDVDARFRTIAERRGRAIGGLSMGGYGALYLGLAHRDRFAAIASHAGVASLLYLGPHPYRAGAEQLSTDPRPWLAGAGAFGPLFRAVFGEDIGNWRSHDPATLAAALEPGAIALYFDCGTEDEFNLDDHNTYLHDQLDAHHIPHTWTLIDGGHHDKRFWTTRIDHSLRFVAAAFGS
ncbi:MAG TPA: alpha/beta hydrolase family protein [Kofleriaceae bacterium]|nr:alpha/beta hydrolase family protein [Kofleriaceae bacterium]